MKLVNDYKLIYVKEVDGVRKLYASKKPVTTDDDAVLVPNLDSLAGVNVVYVKDGSFYTKTLAGVESSAITVKCGTDIVFGDKDTEKTEEKPTTPPAEPDNGDNADNTGDTESQPEATVATEPEATAEVADEE